MPHHPRPFFRKSRKLWYVQIGGHQHNLGPDEAEAFRRYHELMRRPAAAAPVPGDSVVVVLDRFLDWLQKNRAARSFEWYRWYLELFARSLPDGLTVSRLRPIHVTEALARHPGWSPSTRNGLCRAVSRAFRWAERQGIVERSPLAGLEKPRATPREGVISAAEFDTLLACVASPAFRDVLVTAWETGARPQEIVRVEARHVDLARGRWVFPVSESKGKRLPRVVYLNDRALEITRRLARRHPSGPLFRNTDGRPWNRYSLGCAFGRLRLAVGRARMQELGIELPRVPRLKSTAYKEAGELARARVEQRARLRERHKTARETARRHAPRRSLYHLRHSWATRALQRGVDPLTVAILMGHSDPSTLAKVYQHLAIDPEFLQRAARRATGEGA